MAILPANVTKAAEVVEEAAVAAAEEVEVDAITVVAAAEVDVT
jgi:hypothetical protein